MKTKLYTFWILVLVVGRGVYAQGNDPLADAFFPPEFVIQQQSEIGLTAEQQGAIMSRMQQAQDRVSQLQKELQKEVDAFGLLLKNSHVDEKAALSQLDKVLAKEGELKRTHLELVIGIKNKLTADQQAQLQQLKKKWLAHEPPLSLRQKMEKLKAGVEAAQTSGRDLSRVGEIMQEFDARTRDGDFKEAEAIVDRALKALAEAVSEKSR